MTKKNQLDFRRRTDNLCKLLHKKSSNLVKYGKRFNPDRIKNKKMQRVINKIRLL